MATIPQPSRLSIGSPAFKNGENIPVKYTCEGQDINPPLTIGKIPKETKSLVLIIDDPDAVNGTFCHWLMTDIPPNATIEENSAPGIQGLNSLDKPNYSGPCPPSGTHHYFFKVYALDVVLLLADRPDKAKVEQAMERHILATGELLGLYKKSK